MKIEPIKIHSGNDGFDYYTIYKKTKLSVNDQLNADIVALAYGTTPYNRVTMYTLGNISATIGKAKSRKTFFNSMVCAALCYRTGNLYDRFVSFLPQNRPVVYFDTEQSPFDSQLVLKRILGLQNKNLDDVLQWFCLRTCSIQERMKFIENYILTEKPVYVIIDGIIDAVITMNDETIANDTIGTLMRLSTEHNCHINSIIHQNPSEGNSKPQGWLGSVLLKKCETIIEVAKEPDNKAISRVTPLFMRKKEFEEFHFTIQDELPVIVEYDRPKRIRQQQGNSTSPF